MSALENAKKMTKEEVLAKIASSGMKEYGVYQEPLEKRWEDKKAEDLALVVGLNNADTDGVLLDCDCNQVLEGMKILGLALDAKKLVLHIPAYAEGVAKDIENLVTDGEIEVVVGLVDVRANEENVICHFVTMLQIADLFDEKYEPGVYVSVNDGSCKKYKNGTTIKAILEDAGADLSDVKAIKAGYQIFSQDILEKPVEEAEITNGVLRTITSKDCIVQMMEHQIEDSRKQSCGKCVFCREGLLQFHGMLHDITEGKGKSDQVAIMKEIGPAMVFSTPCSMGQKSTNATLDSLVILDKEYDDHIKKKVCDAKVCFSKTVTYIDPKLCEGCGDCIDACPEDCIEGKKKFIHMIDEFDCTQCGECIDSCEYDAIVQTTGKLPKLPDKLTKCGKFKKH